jgi:hypothetical protein
MTSVGDQFALSRREEINLLRWLLERSITLECDHLKKAPSLRHLERFPFVCFAVEVWMKSFPWIQSDREAFWEGAENLMDILSQLETSAAQRDAASLDQLCQRLVKLLTVVFKNILRPYISEEENQKESERDRSVYESWKESEAVSLVHSVHSIMIPNTRANTTRKSESEGFSIRILTSRESEVSGKPFIVSHLLQILSFLPSPRPIWLNPSTKTDLGAFYIGFLTF